MYHPRGTGEAGAGKHASTFTRFLGFSQIKWFILLKKKVLKRKETVVHSLPGSFSVAYPALTSDDCKK